MINDSYVFLTIGAFFLALVVWTTLTQWCVDRREIPKNKFPREIKGPETRRKL